MDCGQVQRARTDPSLARHHNKAARFKGGISLHSVFADLVPPFSSFFTTILNHYGIQALHLQPNSILLLSVFAFYYEAFVGVRPSVTLFRHFFSLRLHDGAHLSACVSFIVAQGGNLLLKAGKKVEKFRHRWVRLSLKDANHQLEEPKGLPEKTCVEISEALRPPGCVHLGALLPRHQRQEADPWDDSEGILGAAPSAPSSPFQAPVGLPAR
ncbi:hypothetical protein D1007_42628 [Hordeum vulgare]|nr:hypothetical protein D1007_42628 [Hordeum vulgare]